MIVLRDAVEIEATPERIFDWFRHLEKNYRSWHPAHVACKYVRKSELQDGSVLYAEEYLHGRLHRPKFRLTEVAPVRGLYLTGADICSAGMAGTAVLLPTSTRSESYRREVSQKIVH